MKILFLLPYPLKQAPSQRFRVEQYFGVLATAGHTWKIQSFLKRAKGGASFDQQGAASKIIAVIRGLFRRFVMLFNAGGFDFVFIHREAAPIGPPVFEWILAKVLRKKIIYDFDDAIWLTDDLVESTFKKWAKWRGKVRLICRWSYKISCGNDWLASFARQHNPLVVVNPTTIDTHSLHRRGLYPEPEKTGTITVGWTGSYTTLKYLASLEPVLQQLEKKYPQLVFLVIADQAPSLQLNAVKFKPWSMATEVRDLMFVDIGVMPLPDDAWANGKCGFKALQYMAMEIPTVLSPVGVNTRIVDENVNGLFATTGAEWMRALETLIVDSGRRQRMGKEGRKKVEAFYSVNSNASNFLALIE